LISQVVDLNYKIILDWKGSAETTPGEQKIKVYFDPECPIRKWQPVNVPGPDPEHVMVIGQKLNIKVPKYHEVDSTGTSWSTICGQAQISVKPDTNSDRDFPTFIKLIT
jgi:hypothetical protein